MTSPMNKCCPVSDKEREACTKQARRASPEWSRPDLEIQAVIRLASGGIETGFDRILVR